MKHEIIHGDCLQTLKTLPDNSVDSIVTDPPAGIGFMGIEMNDYFDTHCVPRTLEALQLQSQKLF